MSWSEFTPRPGDDGGRRHTSFRDVTRDPGQPPQPPRPQPLLYARTNGLAIASFVLSLVWLGGLGALLAVIFGHVSLGQIKRAEGHERGRGLALAGTIIGWIGLVSTIIFYVAVIDAASQQSYYDYGY